MRLYKIKQETTNQKPTPLRAQIINQKELSVSALTWSACEATAKTEGDFCLQNVCIRVFLKAQKTDLMLLSTTLL